MVRNIKAVIFDFDGTLAPTNKYHIISFIEAAKQQGIGLTENDFKGLFGQPTPEILDAFEKKYHCIINRKKLIQTRVKIYKRLIKENNVHLRPDAIATIIQLHKKGLKLGIATGSTAALMNIILGDYAKYFDAIVTADTPTEPKPHPDILLTAAKKLQVSPAHCIFIGDSAKDVETAKNAHMFVIGYSNAYFTSKEIIRTRPDAFIKNLTEILHYVR